MWGKQAKDSSPYTPSQVRGSILVKSHVRSGNDAVSKVGTKHAAPICNPLSLTNFAETDSLTTVDITTALQTHLTSFDMIVI